MPLSMIEASFMVMKLFVLYGCFKCSEGNIFCQYASSYLPVLHIDKICITVIR